jgi:hypothetical protein
MNIFYKPPKNVYTYEQVDEYYRNRRYLILLYGILEWEDTVDDEFINNITSEDLRRYYNICGFKHEEEFIKNLSVRSEEYKKDIVKNYEYFWNFDGNKKYLQEFKRPISSLYNTTDVVNFLRRFQSGLSYDRILMYNPGREPVTLQKAIQDCEKETKVIIKEHYSLFNLLGLQCFSISETNDKGHTAIKGYFYYRNEPLPMTIPLGLGMSFVKAPLTNQLTHEIIHAIQNCYTPFYKYPKELVEIPAMCIERKSMEVNQQYIDRNIALAIADIKADDPDTFDNVFNEESKSTPKVKVSNRFWHYIHYPRQYYAYVLGLIIPFKDDDIERWTKSAEACKIDVEKLISSRIYTKS